MAAAIASSHLILWWNEEGRKWGAGRWLLISKIFIIHKSHIHSTDQFYEVNIELKDFSSTTSSVGYMCSQYGKKT